MASAGFHEIAHETVGLQKNVDDWGAFACGLVNGNPLIDEIQSRGGVDPEDVVRVMEHRLRSAFGPEPGPMPLRAVVFCGKAR